MSYLSANDLELESALIDWIVPIAIAGHGELDLQTLIAVTFTGHFHLGQTHALGLSRVHIFDANLTVALAHCLVLAFLLGLRCGVGVGIARSIIGRDFLLLVW